MFTLRLLGSVVLEGPAGPVSGRATQRRQLALLGMLAAAGRDGASRDKLSAHLWPEASPESAGHSLADTVYRLRKTMGEDALEGRSTTLRLNPALVRVDLVDFEDAVERGDLAGAVALYRGRFLDGFHLKDSSEFEHWRDAEAQRLERQLQTALETLADRATARGDPMEALGWLERLLALDPLNSRTVVRLMEAQAAAGDPANAVKLATEHQELLAEELAVELPADLSALREQLRRAEVPFSVATPGQRSDVGPAPARQGRFHDRSNERKAAAAPPPQRPGSRVPLLWGAAATVLALWLAFGAGAGDENDLDPVRLSITLPEGQRIPTGARVADIEPTPLTLSSDGSLLAYVAVADGSRRVMIREMDGYESRALPGSEGAFNPFLSPDGRWVGFVANGTLMRQALEGGPPQSLAPAPLILGAVWTATDSIIFAPEVGRGLSILPAGGGEPVPLTQIDTTNEWAHTWPELLPGGKRLLFDRWLVPNAHEIVWMSLRDREWHTLLKDAGRPRYLPSGHLVFERQGQLQVQPLDADRMTLGGSPAPFLDTYKGFFSVSGNHLVYLPSVDDPASRTLVRVDRQGDATPLAELPGTVLEPHLSPDGRRLLLVLLDKGKAGLYAYDLRSRQLERLGEGFWPVPEPGGDWLAFTDGHGVFRRRTDGRSGTPELLHPTGHPTSWSAAGTLLLDVEDGIWAVDPGGDAGARELLTTDHSRWGGRFSPDGHLIAYASDESGRDEVYVQPYPGPGGRRMVSLAGGQDPLWSQDGRELFYREGAEVWSVPVSTSGETTFGEPRLLFTRRYGMRAIPSYVYDPVNDGFFMTLVDSVVPSEFRVVVNWRALFR